MENINVPKNVIKYIDVDDDIEKLVKSNKKIKIMYGEENNLPLEKICKIDDKKYSSIEEQYANTDIYIVHNLSDLNSLLDFYSKNLKMLLE